MIPFYMNRLDFMKKEQWDKSKLPNVPKEEMDFLQKNIEETERLLF